MAPGRRAATVGGRRGGVAPERDVALLRSSPHRANPVAIPVNTTEHWSLTGVIALPAAG